MKPPIRPVLAQDAEHLDRQFRLAAIRPACFGRPLLVQIQAEQDRQAERTIGPQGKANHNAQHDPAVAPVGDHMAAAGEQWIVMHAGAEHLQPTLVSQGIVDGQQNDIARQRLDQAKDRQPQGVQRPVGFREEPVERGVMPLPSHPGSQQNAGDGASWREHPTGGERHEVLERGIGHDDGQPLQPDGKRANKIHVSLLSDAVREVHLHREGGSLCLSIPANDRGCYQKPRKLNLAAGGNQPAATNGKDFAFLLGDLNSKLRNFKAFFGRDSWANEIQDAIDQCINQIHDPETWDAIETRKDELLAHAWIST